MQKVKIKTVWEGDPSCPSTWLSWGIKVHHADGTIVTVSQEFHGISGYRDLLKFKKQLENMYKPRKDK